MDKTIHKEKIELLSRLMKDGAISKTEALLLLKNDEGSYTDFISDLKKDVDSESKYVNPLNGTGGYVLPNIVNGVSPLVWTTSTATYEFNNVNLTTNANI